MDYLKLFFERLVPFFHRNPVDQAHLHAKVMQVDGVTMAIRKILVEKNICTEKEIDIKISESLKEIDLGILGGQAIELE